VLAVFEDFEVADFQAGSGNMSSRQSGNSTTPMTHNNMSGISGNSDSNNEPEMPIVPRFDPDEVEVQHPAAPPRRRRGRNKFPVPKVPMPKRWWSWALLLLGTGAIGGGVAARLAIVAIEKDLPNTKDVLTYTRVGSTTIKAEDGTVLQQIGPATRDKIAMAKMPQELAEAFISSEDTEFYNHTGVNYLAIVRASLSNLFAGEVVEGASTITQQLSRIVFLDQERSLTRKAREALLAQKMERELTKDQILENYLNLVYLGSGAYGVADAAWVYFSKPVDQLTLGEMAMIAGMAPAPSTYSPQVNPDLAKQRRNTVLRRMVVAGFSRVIRRISSAKRLISRPM
jgi:penicillin-binding protein 1A